MMLKSEISTASLIVHLILSNASCQKAKTSNMQQVSCLGSIFNTVLYNTDSVNILLNGLESLNLQTSDNVGYGVTLRNVKLANESLYKFISDLYQLCTRHATCGNRTISLVGRKEWKHVENYSLVLKEVIAQIFIASSGNIDNGYRRMPVGPMRNVRRIPIPSKKRPTKETEPSNLNLLTANVLEAMFSRFFVFEFISYAFGDWSGSDKHAVGEDFRRKHAIYWSHFRNLLTFAYSASNVTVEDWVVKKSKEVTALALSIGDTAAALDLHIYRDN